MHTFRIGSYILTISGEKNLVYICYTHCKRKDLELFDRLIWGIIGLLFIWWSVFQWILAQIGLIPLKVICVCVHVACTLCIWFNGPEGGGCKWD